MTPEDFILLKNIPLPDTATDNRTSTVGEPSVLNNGRNLFSTGNWFASRSNDNGANWKYVSPSTTLPGAAGGFCCDQLCLYEQSRNVSVWLLQYSQGGDGENIFRIAINNNDSLSNWYWYDFSPSNVNQNWQGLWFDYPDMAVSDNYLWVTFNVFDNRDAWQRAVVFKFPLDPITASEGFSYSYWSSTRFGSLRLTKGASDAMYWGSHSSTSQLSVFRWAEDENSVTRYDVNVNTWNNGPYSAPGPDGNDWLGRVDPRITGAYITCDEIGFMWTAGRRGNRPFPHVRVVRIDIATMTVNSQPDIWSNNAAYAYPAVYPNRRDHLGISVFYGGGSVNPSHVVGVSDDISTTNWSLFFTSVGTDGPSSGVWGDYLDVNEHAPDGNTWIASGYTLKDGSSRTDIVQRFVHFGRRRDKRGANRWDS